LIFDTFWVDHELSWLSVVSGIGTCSSSKKGVSLWT